METDRDITIILLHILRRTGEIPERSIRVLDGMGATGIRGLRIAKEFDGCQVTINDINPRAVELIKKNIKISGLDNVTSTTGDVRNILSQERFDYVDIDPFGTPAPFIEYALYSLGREGVLAITATDTATLYGSYPQTCLRRYDSLSMRCYLSHEIGLRILCGFVIRKAAIRGFCARPIFSYVHDHYYRIFFMVSKNVKETDEILEEIQFVLFDKNAHKWHFIERNHIHRWGDLNSDLPKDADLAGPLFIGGLIHSRIKEMVSSRDLEILCEGFKKCEKYKKLLDRLWKEADAMPFFYCTHEIGRSVRGAPAPINKILQRLEERGISGYRTHFSPTGLKLHQKHHLERDSIREFIGGLFNNEI